MNAPRSYSTVEVSRRLGVSIQTVQRWVDAGHLKAWVTVGGHRRIEAESAEPFFAQMERGERVGSIADAVTPSQREAVKELIAACNAFCGLYGHLWDVVEPDGAGMLSPDSVAKYDQVHTQMHDALVKVEAAGLKGGTPC